MSVQVVAHVGEGDPLVDARALRPEAVIAASRVAEPGVRGQIALRAAAVEGDVAAAVVEDDVVLEDEPGAAVRAQRRCPGYGVVEDLVVAAVGEQDAVE